MHIPNWSRSLIENEAVHEDEAGHQNKAGHDNETFHEYEVKDFDELIIILDINVKDTVQLSGLSAIITEGLFFPSFKISYKYIILNQKKVWLLCGYTTVS